MIAIEIVLTVIGGLVAVGAALYKAHEKSIPCNTCAHLVKKGGGYWKHVCDGHVTFPYGQDEFDRPPKYCAKYNPMEGIADGQRN